jgi:Uri superfamily endonuclease
MMSKIVVVTNVPYSLLAFKLLETRAGNSRVKTNEVPTGLYTYVVSCELSIYSFRKSCI